MPTIPIGVRVPGWDEDKWAIACERAPHEWSVHDLRVFMGAAARCLPSLSPDDLEYELLPEPGGIRLRIFRGTHGEAVTYTPLALSAATRRAAWSRDDPRHLGPRADGSRGRRRRWGHVSPGPAD